MSTLKNRDRCHYDFKLIFDRKLKNIFEDKIIKTIHIDLIFEYIKNEIKLYTRIIYF